MSRIDPRHILGTRIPGVFLNNIFLDKQGDKFLLSIKFHTELHTKFNKSLLHYFSGAFDKDYKIALFYSQNSTAIARLRNGHLTISNAKRLFSIAQKSEDISLLNIIDLKKAIDIPQEKTKNTFRELYSSRTYKGATIFNLPFVLNASVPISDNLSIFVIPYLSRATAVPNSGVGNSVYEDPGYVGSSICENIIINGETNRKRTFFISPSTGQEIPNEALRGGAKNYRKVVRGIELQDFTVISDMESKLITSEEEYKSNISTNKNYFSKLELTRDKGEQVRGFFGVDLLSIARDNFPYSKILYNSSLDVVKRFMNMAKISVYGAVERDVNSKRPTGSPSFASKTPVSVIGLPERVQRPFVMHYSFKKPNNNKSLYGEYEYSVSLRVDISNIYKRVAGDRQEIHRLNNPLYLQQNPSYITEQIIKYFKIYSLKDCTAKEEATYRVKLRNLLKTSTGREKILELTSNLENMVDQIFLTMRTGTTKKDPTSAGGFPSNHNAGGVNHSVTIRHNFKETYDMKANPRNYGADYVDNLFRPLAPVHRNPMRSIPVTYSVKQLEGRIKSEERRYLLDKKSFASDISNITNEEFNQNLDLNLQKISFLAPFSITTGFNVNDAPLVYDYLPRISPKEYDKYDYLLLKYLTSKAVQSQKLPPHPAYHHPNRPMKISNNGFILARLVQYFMQTKNIEVLTLYKEIIKQQKENQIKSYDPDDTSSSKIPDTSEGADDDLEQIIPKDMLVSMLSSEIFNDGVPFNPLESYHLPTLLKESNYQQFASLPNQIKALIKYYDYVAKETIQTYQPTQKDSIEPDLQKIIIDKLSQEDAASASGYVYVSFLNLKELQVFQGYELTAEGEVLMNKPIYSKLQSYAQLSGTGLTLCRLMDYKNLKFNIPETGYFPIYNEYFFIKSSSTPPSQNPNLPGAPATNTQTGGTGY